MGTAAIKPDWWKVSLDETYLKTDARCVCGEELTCQEVDFVEQILDMGKFPPILDVCGGQGRRSLEFFQEGLQGCERFRKT